MNYGLTESGASNSDANKYFRKARYNSYLVDYNYDTYKKCIDNNKSLYLSGSAKRKGIWFIFRWGWKYSIGHAWVGDGYRKIKHWKKYIVDRGNKNGGITYENRNTESHYIHMNWGWGKNNSSQSNNGGWCTYDYFKSSSDNFKYKKQMITY